MQLPIPMYMETRSAVFSNFVKFALLAKLACVLVIAAVFVLEAAAVALDGSAPTGATNTTIRMAAIFIAAIWAAFVLFVATTKDV